MEFPDTAIVRTRVRASRAGAALLTFVPILVAAGAIGISAQPAAGTPGTSGAFAASATEQEPDPFSYDEILTQHRFESSGAGRRRERVAVRVLNQAGVTAFSTLVFRYMAATEQVAIQQLTVEKPDGRKISPSSLTLEDEATGAIDATILDDLRAKRIAVPALEPGDRLIFEVTYTISGSLVPGHFWIDHTFIRNVPVTQETVEIDAPSSRALKVRTRRGQQESSGAAAASGRQVMRWTHRQMRGILDASDQIVVVIAPSLDGARAASSTLDWLEENGYGRLVDGAVGVVNGVRTATTVLDLDRVEGHFAARCRATVRIPWDRHLETGAETVVEELASDTRQAYLELAAAIAAGFVQPLERT